MSGSLIYAIFLGGICALMSGLVTVGAQRRNVPGAKAFCVLIGLAAWWCLLEAEWVVLVSPRDLLMVNKLGYLAYAFIPVGWIALVYDYRSMLNRRAGVIAALCVVPVLTLCFAWAYPAQHIFWVSYAVRQVNGLNLLDCVHGPWWWVHLGYSYALTLTGIVMLVRAFFSRGPLPRAQTILFAAGVTVPLLCNVVYTFGAGPLPGLDLTPAGFALSVLFLLIALLHYRFLELLPVAFDRVVHQMPSPVVVLDRSGCVMSANPAARHNFWLGRNPVGVTFQLQARSAQDGSTLQVDRHSPSGLQFSVVQGGVQREFLLDRVELKTRKGKALGHLFVMYDQTSETLRARQLEEAVRSAAAAASEAAEASRAKSAFLATMSHEIRTPLNVIIGSASLLSEEALSPQQREYAETIHSSGQSLLSVLNDVLDVSKIEAGRMTLEEVVFDLRGAVEDVMELFITSAATRHLHLTLAFDARLDGIYNGDPGRLKQVLVNLVGNALKFTEAGSVEVRVEPGERSRVVRFSVTDTGIGIDQAAQAHLFAAFQQADNTTTRRFGGTGLGLAIARRLVELMGGSITCESAPGVGSCFSFSVPLPLVELPRSPELRGACAVFAAPAPKLEPIMALLRCTGYEPYLASERYPVLEDPPALVIVDPQWPGFGDAEEARRFVDAVAAIDSLQLVRLAPFGAVAPEWAEGLPALAEPWMLRRFRAALCSQENVVSKLDSTNAYPGRRLLLVEDNPLNRRLALRMLQRLGCDVDEAVDGLEAVTRAGQKRYDLILMDLQMPGADGFEATRRIRRNELDCRRVRVPIVAFTAGVFSGERKQAFDAGMDDFLSKPVMKEQLLRTCSRWFDSADKPRTGSLGGLG